MQVTPEAPYSELATAALTGLSAPSYEQMAEALERAQRELDEYATENSDMGDRITVLEDGLSGALATLEFVMTAFVKMIGDGIEAVNKLW